MDHVVRADLDRDERDLSGMRVQERDRRVQLRPGGVVAQRVLPGDHRAGRLTRATDVPEGEPGICCCMVSNRSSTYPSVVLPWPGW